MITLLIRIDFRSVYAFLGKLDLLFGGYSGYSTRAMESLANIMRREMKGYVAAGGTAHKVGGAHWPRTHERWVGLRQKGHDRPLAHTGAFEASIDAFPLSGEFGVRAGAGSESAYGTSLAGAARFHSGDDGRQWFTARAGDELRGSYQVAIQERPYLEVFQEDVDMWMDELGAQLGFS